MSNKHAPALFWDSPYAIALALIEHHPELDPELVGLGELETIVKDLPNFMDDSSFVNTRFLLDIQIEWYEEKSNL
jgi:FeS assembly protein IscX